MMSYYQTTVKLKGRLMVLFIFVYVCTSRGSVKTTDPILMNEINRFEIMTRVALVIFVA